MCVCVCVRERERERRRASDDPIKLIIFHGRESMDVTSFNLLKITCSSSSEEETRFFSTKHREKTDKMSTGVSYSKDPDCFILRPFLLTTLPKKLNSFTFAFSFF